MSDRGPSQTLEGRTPDFEVALDAKVGVNLRFTPFLGHTNAVHGAFLSHTGKDGARKRRRPRGEMPEEQRR